MKNERVISPIKGRLLHHIIECRTPNKKINNKKMDLSINNIIGNIYNNNLRGNRKFNFETFKIKLLFFKVKILQQFILIKSVCLMQLKIIMSLKNELLFINEENIKIKN